MEESTYWLEEAPVFKAIKHMALPMIFAMAIGTIYNFTDTLFIGFLGDTSALAAVSLCLPYLAVVMALADLVGVGVGTAISRHLGMRDGETTKHLSSFALWATLVLSAAVAFASLVCMDPLLSLLGATGDARRATQTFLSVTALAVPASMLNLALCQVVRAKADSKTAMYGMMGSSVLNIVLDPAFIFGLHAGIAGAAWATAIANLAAVIYYATSIAKSPEFTINPRFAAIKPALLAEVLKIGSAAMLMALLTAVSSLVLNTAAMAYGEEVVAGFGVSQSIVQLISLVAMGIFEGVVPLIAAAYGAENHARIREIVQKTALCLAVFCLAAGSIVFAFRGTLVSLFTSDSSVVAIASAILTAQLFACAFECVSGLITGIFQAEGKGIAANVVSVVRGGALIPCILVGSAVFGLDGVVWALLAAEAASATVCAGMYAVIRTKGKVPNELAAGSTAKAAIERAA